MKNLNTLNLPEDMALPVQNFIYNAVCSNELMLVFYTPVVNSKLKVLTLVVDKQNYNAIVCVLQPQIDTLSALEKYDTLISINYHKVSSNDSQFHFSYLQLHLQPCFVIYSNHSKSWNSLFQNFYTNDKQKAINHFKNYSREVENKVNEAISIFVIPLVKQKVYKAAQLALLEVFSYYFDMLKNILLPKSLHYRYDEQEFKVFIETYYSEFSKILNQIAKVKTYSFNDQSQYLVGESKDSIFNKTLNRSLKILASAWKNLNVFYTKRIETQLSDKSDEEALLKQLVAFLVHGYKLDAIYLVGSKILINSNSNGTYKFNLLLISPTLRIQQHDVLVQKVSNHFKGKVEVFCLIHTLEWIQKNENKYQLFFNEFIVPQNILYLKSNLVINKKLVVTYNTKQLQDKYWTERLAFISPWFSTFQNQDLVYQSGHILLLKNMLQHLILGLLYQKLQYIPTVYSCKYLMQLFQALLPETFNKCGNPNDTQTILDLLSIPIDFLPKTDHISIDVYQLTCAKILSLCEKLFTEIQCTNN